jgi:phosphatidate cytidylyltransferase
LMGLSERNGAKPPRVAVLVAILALFAGNFQWPDWTREIFGVLCLGLVVYCTFLRPVTQVLADASASVFCMFYVGATLLALPSLHEETNGSSLIVFLLCVVWAGDTAAFYIGRAWGRHKMTPTLSPGKTWEGAVASLLGSMLVAAALVSLAALLQEPRDSVILSWLERAWPSAMLSYPDENWFWIGLAALVNVAAQVGDLAESAMKRSAGVKDSGSLLPGHGGVLDRIDALLLAAPVLWYAQVIHQRF